MTRSCSSLALLRCITSLRLVVRSGLGLLVHAFLVFVFRFRAFCILGQCVWGFACWLQVCDCFCWSWCFIALGYELPSQWRVIDLAASQGEATGSGCFFATGVCHKGGGSATNCDQPVWCLQYLTQQPAAAVCNTEWIAAKNGYSWLVFPVCTRYMFGWRNPHCCTQASNLELQLVVLPLCAADQMLGRLQPRSASQAISSTPQATVLAPSRSMLFVCNMSKCCTVGRQH